MNVLGLQFRALKRSNWILLLAMLALVAIGVLFIRSACASRQELIIRGLYRMQIVWALAGLGVFAFTSMLDYRRLLDGVWLFYASAIVLLVMVLVIGEEIYGSRRWLDFFGMNLQPSEVGKLALLLAVAGFLSRPGLDPARWQSVAVVLALTALPLILILKEPDLGTAIVCLPIVFSMLYAGGASLKHFGVLALAGGLVVGVLFGAILVPRWMGMDTAGQKAVFTRVTRLKEYQWKRLVVFVDPASDRKGAGYNSWQSAIAVGSGGLTGKGYMRGTQSSLGYLPRTVASTDFIFAVIAEEMGFAGGAVVLGLFAVIIASGMLAAARARDKLGRLIGTGVTAMIFAHVFVNIAMTIGMMPVTGIPLPLVSYGGSFMLCTMASLGLVQSVYCRRI
jgi:rod shape determining protein RodA